jgi:hypothetical protein
MAIRTADPPTSYVFVDEDGVTSYVGSLAVKLYRAQTLREHLARPLGPSSTKKLLVIVQAFTGRSYVESDRLNAISDLDDWIRGMELIVPVLQEKPAHG